MKLNFALFALMFLSAYAPKADACGGLFCSNINQQPVDQNAERILFDIEDDGRITATVEIRYAGDAESFAWIIPVPEVPDLVDVAPANALRVLDSATSPQILFPQVERCPQTTQQFFVGGCGAGGCGACDASPLLASPGEGEGEFEVTDLPTVGPFDPEVIDAEDPAVLIEWLNDNDYLITPQMHPLIEQYVADGYKFLGVKLTPDANVNDIQPIVFSCPQGDPLIPLKLTAVAAEPEMGVMVFITGAERYASMNFRTLDVPTERVHANPFTGSNNYYPLMSKIVDEEGGKAFVTEFAGSTNSVTLRSFFDQESFDWATELLQSRAFMTRLYTRISAHEMDDDPVFIANGTTPVSNVQDLSERTVAARCGNDPLGVPCGQTYCGEGSICAVDEAGVSGCVCANGDVAREITSPALGRAIVCQPEGDFLGDIGDEACALNNCGPNGRCVAVGGFPTCRCDAGFMATIDDEGQLSCAAFREEVEQSVDWPEDFYATPAEMVASRALNLGANPFVMFGVLLLAGKAWRWRRRHNESLKPNS